MRRTQIARAILDQSLIMETQKNPLVEAITGHLTKMDVPSYKTDVTKPKNVEWLLKNLPSRNKDKPNFKPLMQSLLVHAETVNVLKVRERKAIADSLKG